MGQAHYQVQQCTQNISINTGFQLIINNTRLPVTSGSSGPFVSCPPHLPRPCSNHVLNIRLLNFNYMLQYVISNIRQRKLLIRSAAVKYFILIVS